jgi:hypothetical protein
MYHLVPVDRLLRDRTWLASAHRGPCCVSAPNEALARRFAAQAFWVPAVAAELTPQREAPAAPWSERRLVGARELATPSDQEAPPQGAIFVPADPGCPGGMFVALGRS